VALDADVSNRFHCVKLIEATRAHWRRLDFLVNHAHVAPVAPVLKMDEWDWSRCLDVNLKGTFFMSQLVGRVMAGENGERGGCIVNITSVAGNSMPWEQRAAFCASQAGIAGFTRECAREYAAYGLRVYALLRPLAAAEEAERQVIASIVVSLCGEAGRQLTGAVLTVEEALDLV
jgi:NAD(P)-dependent dehydrogenase (short-subunit alcohol dehydrogenase family)